jgi:enoyl-CoA hydratase/carnithine racemase
VAHIDLDDGKVNVMSAAMLADIYSALDSAEAGADIVVLRSARPGIFPPASISRCSLPATSREAWRW